MGLETATYIGALNEAWPDGADPRTTVDNHIRLGKAALKRTFVNLNGPVVLTHDKFNFLNDVSRSVQYQINQLRDGESGTVAVATVANYANSASYAANAGGLIEFSASAIAAQWSAGQVAVLARTADQFVRGAWLTRQEPTYGYVGMRSGSQTLPGYVEFFTPNGTRRGYIGWGNSSGFSNRIGIFSENSYGWDFSGPLAPTIGGFGILHTESEIPGPKIVGTIPNAAISLPAIQQHQASINAGNAVNATFATGAGNANTVGGYAPNDAIVGSTVVVRSDTGDIGCRYVLSTGGAEDFNAAAVVVKNGADNFLRSVTTARLGAVLSAQNITGRSGTAKILASGSGPPSLTGSVNGDFFFYY